MTIENHSEKEIRDKILNKINPKLGSAGKRAKHNKGYIYLEDKLITKVKIPNSHCRIMKPKKAGYIAEALNLNAQEFNDLIKCPLTGPKYYQLLKKKTDDKN